MPLYIDQRYAELVSGKLRNFRRAKPTLFNFSCPICGDSAKNQRKARGYLYEYKNALRYKCHNCGAGLSMRNFLEAVDPSIARSHSTDSFTNLRERGPVIRDNPQVEKSFISDQLSTMREMLRLIELPSSDPVKQYAEKRHIPTRFFQDLWTTKRPICIEELC